jgi:hypothetical protein
MGDVRYTEAFGSAEESESAKRPRAAATKTPDDIRRQTMRETKGLFICLQTRVSRAAAA